jgi:hypothetical protein
MFTDDDVDRWCRILHDAYEEAAYVAGWETNPRSRVPWDETPDANKAAMRAAVRAVAPAIAARALREAADDLPTTWNAYTQPEHLQAWLRARAEQVTE